MTFDQKVIRNGRITVGIACIANFVPALYVDLKYGVQPSISVLLQLYGALAATYGITWIIQPIAYYPTMGAAGSYIGWLAGSCGDIRMPAAAMAQKIVGVEPGTHEGDVIGTLGVACSVFVSASLITLFVIIGNQVIPMLPPFITGSFSYILPSLFGAIFVDNARKNLKARTLHIRCRYRTSLLRKEDRYEQCNHQHPCYRCRYRCFKSSLCSEQKQGSCCKVIDHI